MPRLRALLIALTILFTATAPLFVPGVDLGSVNGRLAFAAVGAAPVSQNDDDDANNDGDDGTHDDQAGDDDMNDDDGEDDDNDNDGDADGDDDGADADDADGDDDGEGDDDGQGDDDGDGGNDRDGGDDDGDDTGGTVVPAASQRAVAPSAPACSTPGQQSSFASGDGRVTVTVYANMPQSLKFSIRHPVDPASVPPPPGTVVGGHLFQLIAEDCDGSPVAVLPQEINLGVRYSDGDASGLNEASFTLSRLDTSANSWRAVEKQAADPSSNFTSATVTEMGYYVLYPQS